MGRLFAAVGTVTTGFGGLVTVNFGLGNLVINIVNLLLGNDNIRRPILDILGALFDQLLSGCHRRRLLLNLLTGFCDQLGLLFDCRFGFCHGLGLFGNNFFSGGNRGIDLDDGGVSLLHRLRLLLDCGCGVLRFIRSLLGQLGTDLGLLNSRHNQRRQFLQAGQCRSRWGADNDIHIQQLINTTDGHVTLRHNFHSE